MRSWSVNDRVVLVKYEDIFNELIYIRTYYLIVQNGLMNTVQSVGIYCPVVPTIQGETILTPYLNDNYHVMLNHESTHLK